MRRLGLLAILATLALAVAACGSDKATAPSASTAKAHTFTLDEWSIVPPKGTLTAGKIAITATNSGKETHELVIVRAADAGALPKKADGSVDEDKIPESKKAGEIGELRAGRSTSKTLDLPAGTYVAFCNLVEDMGSGSGMGNSSTTMHMTGGGMHHVHYALGMETRFTVS